MGDRTVSVYSDFSDGDTAGPARAAEAGDVVLDGDGNVISSIDHINIYYVGKHGDDTRNGMTEDNAFLTIGAAIAVAVSDLLAQT